MVLTYIDNLSSSHQLLKSASELALQLGKNFSVLSFVKSENQTDEQSNIISEQLKYLNITEAKVMVENGTINNLSEIAENKEVSFLFLQLSEISKRKIRFFLSACRDLRIPYILYKDEFKVLKMNEVLVPVNYLEEEVEKAQFGAAFGRFCDSTVRLLVAKDYGSKADKNAEKIVEIFNKFNFNFSVEKGKSDSFKIDKEAVATAGHRNAGLIIVSASREYGLDDILFGPKELHLIKRSDCPILLINPRADLYALCD